MFHGRDDELETLAREFDTDEFSFVVVYGRRRVGKTELIREFCADREHLYHLASQDSAGVQREKLTRAIADYRDERVPQLEDWQDVASYLGETLSSERMVFAIDEFPYLVESDDRVLSAFQHLTDEYARDSASTLILCGSSIGVMESDVMGHESPLYGRRTAQIDLQPFDFTTAHAVIDYDLADAIRSFATTGGMPMYLTLFDYDRSLEANLLANQLSKTSVLYNEPEFLLRTELRNPSRYMSILGAVANGYTTPNEISGQTDIGTGPLSTYLGRLRRLRLLEREVPVTAASKKSKRSRYRVADEFLRFWFRFVEPNRAGIERAPELVLEDRIRPELDAFTAETFEDVCQEALWTLSIAGEFDTSYGVVGRWWYGGEEIDVVGLNEREETAIFGECKWTSSPVGEELARQLEAKAESVRWRNGNREESFVLFSRSGFTDGLADTLDDRWHLYDLEALGDVFTSKSS